MTDEKPEVRYCRYLTRWLKEAYQNGYLPSSFKDEAVEFQSFWVRDGWDIYWVLHGKQLDSVHIDRQKSNDWKEADLEEWSKEVVAGWIDAYLYPQIDRVDLDEIEQDDVPVSPIEPPASSNGMGGEAAAKKPLGIFPKFGFMELEISAHNNLRKSQEAAAGKTPKIGVIGVGPIVLTLTGSEAGAWTNVKMQPAWTPKVGDWVRIKKPENSVGWIEGMMDEHDGKIVQVADVDLRSIVHNGWYFPFDWLEPAEQPVIKPVKRSCP